jgi:LuxR family maltose regulon positive regulatory protein
MDIPLLQTKFYVPAIRNDFVARPRLIERLNRGLHGKLTLISAPACFGKTTLLSDWLGQIDRPFSWLSLDENDNDPTRFLTYFVAALQHIEAKIGQTVQSQLQSLSFEVPLTILINDIIAFQQQIVVVLDDYHLIDASPVHHALTFLLDNCPSNLHLVIASRADLPFPVTHLLARGQANEVRAQDLIFSAEETAILLNQINILDLSTTDLEALARRTEGWIAGLQLAAISLHRLAPEERHAFITSFAGNDRYVLDYLMSEELQQQPAARQAFLLYTSLLNELNADLIATVINSTPTETQATLQALEHENMFLIPLDNWRAWYRYHHLFADLLRNRLAQLHPEMIPIIHRRASAWYTGEKRLDAAIRHSLAANDMEQVAQHLMAEDLLRHANPGQILAWLAQMPASVLESHPLLAIKHLWVLLETGHLDEVLKAEQLDEVETRLQALEKIAAIDPELRHETLIIRIHLARHQQAYDLAISLGEQLLAQLPTPLTPKSLSTKLGVVFGLAEAYRLTGELMEAQTQFSEAVRLSEMIGSVAYVLRAQLGLAQVQSARNEWNAAVSTLQNILTLADPDFPLETTLAQELLAKARKHTSPPTTPLIESLTSRELDVLGWLNSELSVTEIGEHLFVSTNTVKTHVKNIYAKLGTRSRYEAVAAAKELGLL